MSGALTIALVIAHLALPTVWFGHQETTRPTTHRQRVGQWTLAVTHDPFAGTISCALWARAMTYDRRAVTFYFGGWARTFEALYKVDDGPAVPWRANAMLLASTGALVQSEDLDNPSAGRVVVPVKALVAARSISIRLSPRQTAHVFAVGDLPAALARAAAAGCGPDYSAEVAQ